MVRTFGIVLFTLSALGGLSGFSARCCEATVYHSDGSEASVRACIHSAADGDIVTIPAGTFTWTSALNITKGITLQGQTTVSGAGTAAAVANDLTIIRDDTPRGGAGNYIFSAHMPTENDSFRLTGVTFAPGTTTVAGTTNGPVRLASVGENHRMRVDHCHFDNIYQTRCIWVNAGCFGVVDHCLFNERGGMGGTETFLIAHGSYVEAGAPSGSTRTNGNGSWADYPWYGTDKFVFLETNTHIFSHGGGAVTDTDLGARFVFRNNYVHNATVQGHGTELNGPSRGGRVNEIYDNEFNWPTAGHPPTGNQRSGTCFWHDNIFTGAVASNPYACTFQNVRESYLRAHPIWGIADGTSVWDANDTEGNGTFVEGHAPHLFASGAATTTTSEGTLADATKAWTPDQWKGYSVRNTTVGSASYHLGSFITANTDKTISYVNSAGAGHLIFNSGDTYEIHRVLKMMDQNGGGKTDLIHGNPPINSTTGTASYAHITVEPCYSWNNVYTPTNTSLGFNTVYANLPTSKLNIDYFNLGMGFPADTTPSAVSSRYTAALNGVAYTGTFTYPHPLVSGAPTPTPSATPRSQQHLQKKEAKKLKRRKGGAKKIGE